MSDSKRSTETVMTPEDREMESFRKSIAPNPGKTSALTLIIVGGALLLFVGFFYGLTHQHERPQTTPNSATP